MSKLEKKKESGGGLWMKRWRGKKKKMYPCMSMYVGITS